MGENWWKEQDQLLRDIKKRLRDPPAYISKYFKRIKEKVSEFTLSEFTDDLKRGTPRAKKGNNLYFTPTKTKKDKRSRQKGTPRINISDNWARSRTNTPKKSRRTDKYITGKRVDYGNLR